MSSELRVRSGCRVKSVSRRRGPRGAVVPSDWWNWQLSVLWLSLTTCYDVFQECIDNSKPMGKAWGNTRHLLPSIVSLCTFPMHTMMKKNIVM